MKTIRYASEANIKDYVAASCRLSLHACNRSLLARGTSIDSHAYVISLHARWPIRAPSLTCADQDAWAVITPKRPKANCSHTNARHAWTWTLLRNTVQGAVFFPNIFSRLINFSFVIVPFRFGRSRHGWGLFLKLLGTSNSGTLHKPLNRQQNNGRIFGTS